MISQYFDKHFTLANGVAYTGAACGQMLIPLLAGSLINAYGWRGTMLILSAGMSHLIACGTVLIPRSRLKQNAKSTDIEIISEGNYTYENKTFAEEAESGDAAVNPSVEESTSRSPKKSSSSATAPNSKSSSLKSSRYAIKEGQLIVRSLVQNVNFDIVLILFFLMGFLFYIPVAHTLPIALKAGISESDASLLPTLFGVGSLFGRLVPSFLADFFKLPKDIIDMFAFVTCAVCNAFMILFNTFWHFVVYHLIYGCATGVSTVFTFTIVQVILPPEHRGFGVGLATLFFAVGDSTGSISAGKYMASPFTIRTSLLIL